MSELEKRETQFSSVLDRGESLKIGHHAASQVCKTKSTIVFVFQTPLAIYFFDIF